MPRYIGFGFGLGSFNLLAQQDGRNAFAITAERRQYYFEHRRSVVPSLVHLGSDTPEAIAARIDAAATLPITHPWIPETQWQRW